MGDPLERLAAVVDFEVGRLEAPSRQKNQPVLRGALFTSNIHQRKPHRRPTPERVARANTKRSGVHSAVEHVFAGQKHRMGLIVPTSVPITRARIKIGMAHLAYNFQRLA